MAVYTILIHEINIVYVAMAHLQYNGYSYNGNYDITEKKRGEAYVTCKASWMHF